MSHPDFPYVMHSELEKVVRRALLLERIAAWALIALSAGMVVIWVQQLGETFAFWGLAMFLGAFFWVLHQSGIPKGVLVEHAYPDLLGEYTPEQLHAIVREVCEAFYEKEIPSVYVVEDTREAMAAVVNVDILNFIKPWNALYIGPHLLHSLDPDELKAVLSHEMCHFTIHYTFWTRFFYLKAIIFAIWVTFFGCFFFVWFSNEFLQDINTILIIFPFVFAFYVCQIGVGLIAGVLGSWTSRADSQEVEALCDYEAVKRYGVLPMVNVLLKLGTRQEIFTTLIAQFSPDQVRPIEGILQQEDGEEKEVSEEERLAMVQQLEAIQAAYSHLNNTLPLSFISLEDSVPYIEEAVQVAIEEHQAERHQHPPRHVARWLEHDINIANQKLDRVEYESFIAELKQNPDKPVFYIPEEMDEELNKEAEHPTLRNRILFLEYNRHHSPNQLVFNAR